MMIEKVITRDLRYQALASFYFLLLDIHCKVTRVYIVARGKNFNLLINRVGSRGEPQIGAKSSSQ